MQLNKYLEFIESQGITTVKTESCAWQQIGPRGFITAPGCFPVLVQKSDIRKMFLGRGALFLRIIEPESQIQSEQERWHRYVCTKPYDLEHLEKKARNQTRRGCENCNVLRITFERLAEEGVKATVDTHTRHGLTDEITERAISEWKHKVREYGRWPDIRVYAAYINQLGNELGAFLISILVDNSWFISVHRSTNESLSYYPNNALIFEATKDLLNTTGVDGVINGIESLQENEGLKRFKTGLGFQLQPIRHRILFHPLARPLLTSPGKSIVTNVSRYLMRNNLLKVRTQKRIEVFYERYMLK